MPPVGNDVVDLAAPGNRGKSGDERFCGRVFRPEERALIDGAAEPDALLWALWAAKEAAYKAVSRRDPSVCSIPRQYRVEIRGDSSLFISQGIINRELSPFVVGKVVTPRGDLALRIERTEDWVHATAAESEEAVDRLYRCVEAPRSSGDPSAFVREGLLREIARFLDCSTRDLSLVGDPDCPAAPTVHFRRRPLTKEVSLSHDGRFTAFAFHPPAALFSGSPC